MGCGVSSTVAHSHKPVSIDHFYICEVLGKGAFGKVDVTEIWISVLFYIISYGKLACIDTDQNNALQINILSHSLNA